MHAIETGAPALFLALADPPAIARFDSMREPNQSLRALSLSMIEQYRRLSTH